MAFRKRPRSPEQTFNPNDPLDINLWDTVPLPDHEYTNAQAIVPIPTGLSDEEDAKRHLAFKFDDGIGFCRNCEGHYKMEGTHNLCPVCLSFLSPVGTPPAKRKS